MIQSGSMTDWSGPIKIRLLNHKKSNVTRHLNSDEVDMIGLSNSMHMLSLSYRA
jgi:hypothetical protein